jgi:hypothetical protein
MGAGELEELHVGEAARLEELGGGLGGAAHFGGIEAVEGDAGDARQRLEIVEIGVALLVEMAKGFFRRGHGLQSISPP